MQKNYESFSTDQFLDDPFFIEWIKYETPEAAAFWKGWINQGPANIAAMKGAELQLRALLSAKRIEPGNSDASEVWERIGQNISTGRVVQLRSRKKFLLAAASVAAAFLIGSILWVTNNKNNGKPINSVIATKYGEMKTVTLPDASEVILNANSSIRFKRSWNKDQPREIWLEGEAFFDIRHLNKEANEIQPHERFLVYTNDLTVEVLGTSFNIRKRRGKTEVVLQTGKIRVTLKNNSQSQIIMAPGNVIKFDSVSGSVARTDIMPQSYTAWKEKKLELTDSTSIKEIISYLEDNFGKKIILLDTNLEKKIMGGTLILDNFNDALFSLSILLNAEVIKTDSTILFKARD